VLEPAGRAAPAATYVPRDVSPGLDSARLDIGGAAGLRVPWVIAPIAFAEAGIGQVHQGYDGARATGGYYGLGAGVELWLPRVRHPDLLWTTTTLQVGGGYRF